MATVNALSVALFNAAAGGYAAEMTANAAGFANSVGPILEKDVSTDALFVDHLLGNLGVTSTNAVYAQAKTAVAALVTTKGRAGATTDAVDFLKAQEGTTSAYAAIADAFAAKVAKATAYTTANATERDITKLISGVTGVDTDAAAVAAAVAAAEAAAATAAAAAATKAAATLAAAEAAAAAAATKAAADLAAAEAAAEAAATKAAADLAAVKAELEAVKNPAGETKSLSTGVDAFVGTAGNDSVSGTIAASGETFSATDVVVDNSSKDSDTLNITSTVANTTGEVGTISNFENVNFVFNTLDNSTLDAGSITGSSITVSQAKSGSTGGVTVSELVSKTNVNFSTGVVSATAEYTVSSTKAGTSGASVNGGSADTVTVSGADNTGVTITAANAATVNIVGAGHSTKNIADDAATVNAAATVTIDANGDAGNQVENLTVQGNGAATVATISGDGVEKYTVAGAYSVTLSGDEAVFDGETATDKLTAGVSTLRITTANDSDLSKIALDVINIASDAVKADADFIVATGANITISTGQTADDANDELEFSGKASTAETNSITVTFDNSSSTTTFVTTPELIFSDFATVNLVAVDKIYGATATTATVIAVDEDATINISGSATVNIAAGGTNVAALVDASALTKGLTIQTSEQFAVVIGGSAADTIKLGADTVSYDLDGGAGSDTLYIADAGDYTGNTFVGFEVIKVNGDADVGDEIVTVDSSLVSGTAMSIVTGASGDTLNLVADESTVDLSSLTLGTGVSITLDTTDVADAAMKITGLAATAMTITGGVGADTLTGGSGADSLVGGAGADTLNGGRGANTIDGGSGNDVIVGGSVVDNITGGTGADVITAGTGVDIINYKMGVTAVAGIDGVESFAVDFAAGKTKSDVTDGYAIVSIGDTDITVAISALSDNDEIAAAIQAAIDEEGITGVTAEIDGTDDTQVNLTFDADVFEGALAANYVTVSFSDADLIDVADSTEDVELEASVVAVTSTSKVATPDNITDYDGDTLVFDIALTVAADADGTSTKADIADGIATFETSGSTSVTEKLVAINLTLAGASAVPGTVVAFEHGSDSYVFAYDADADASNDVLIKITGVLVDELTVGNVVELTLGF